MLFHGPGPTKIVRPGLVRRICLIVLGEDRVDHARWWPRLWARSGARRPAPPAPWRSVRQPGVQIALNRAGLVFGVDGEIVEMVNVDDHPQSFAQARRRRARRPGRRSRGLIRNSGPGPV